MLVSAAECADHLHHADGPGVLIEEGQPVVDDQNTVSRHDRCIAGIGVQVLAGPGRVGMRLEPLAPALAELGLIDHLVRLLHPTPGWFRMWLPRKWMIRACGW